MITIFLIVLLYLILVKIENYKSLSNDLKLSWKRNTLNYFKCLKRKSTSSSNIIKF